MVECKNDYCAVEGVNVIPKGITRSKFSAKESNYTYPPSSIE